MTSLAALLTARSSRPTFRRARVIVSESRDRGHRRFQRGWSGRVSFGAQRRGRGATRRREGARCASSESPAGARSVPWRRPAFLSDIVCAALRPRAGPLQFRTGSGVPTGPLGSVRNRIAAGTERSHRAASASRALRAPRRTILAPGPGVVYTSSGQHTPVLLWNVLCVGLRPPSVVATLVGYHDPRARGG